MFKLTYLNLSYVISFVTWFIETTYSIIDKKFEFIL